MSTSIGNLLNNLSLQISVDAFVTEVEDMAADVALSRRYADGDHDNTLNDHQKKMLNIKRPGSMPFASNYLELVITTFADRLNLQAIAADNDKATKWIASLLQNVRLDGLQLPIHESTIRDGNTYMLTDWNPKTGRVRWTHEPAFDGVTGVIPRYATPGDKEPEMVIKTWHVRSTNRNAANDVRANLYFPDRIEKYISINSSSSWLPFKANVDESHIHEWKPGIIPFVHFKNRATRYSSFGKSEINGLIPMQDGLNRTNVSMVTTAEKTAFPIRVAKGFAPPQALEPGVWIVISPDQTLSPDEIAEAFVMEQGDISAFEQQAEYFIRQILILSNTPDPSSMGSSASSGEALKQREIGLLGKCKRFKVSNGNEWENAVEKSRIIQATFGQAPPEFESATCQWDKSEIRGDTEVIDNGLKVADYIPRDELLRIWSQVFGWDEQRIQTLAGNVETEMDARAFRLSQANGFAGVDFGAILNAA